MHFLVSANLLVLPMLFTQARGGEPSARCTMSTPWFCNQSAAFAEDGELSGPPRHQQIESGRSALDGYWSMDVQASQTNDRPMDVHAYHAVPPDARAGLRALANAEAYGTRQEALELYERERAAEYARLSTRKGGDAAAPRMAFVSPFFLSMYATTADWLTELLCHGPPADRCQQCCRQGVFNTFPGGDGAYVLKHEWFANFRSTQWL